MRAVSHPVRDEQPHRQRSIRWKPDGCTKRIVSHWLWWSY